MEKILRYFLDHDIFRPVDIKRARETVEDSDGYFVFVMYDHLHRAERNQVLRLVNGETVDGILPKLIECGFWVDGELADVVKSDHFLKTLAEFCLGEEVKLEG